MLKKSSHHRITASVTALAAVFAVSALAPAHAQERKSLRWATSAVGSYGYQIAAQMTKIVEEALGGQYTVTVQPYASPTVAMKAVMDGNAEIAYTADIGMTQFHERIGGLGDLAVAVHHRLHGDGGRGIRLDRDGVLAAERLFDDLDH